MLSKCGFMCSGRKCIGWFALLGCVIAVSTLVPFRTLADQSNKEAATLHRIPFQYRQYAIAAGQRFIKAGKERISASGKLAHFGDDQNSEEAIRIIRQSPSRIRLDQNGKTTVFDRNRPGHAIPESQKTANTIQVLLEDSTEGFLDLLQDCIGRRHLGSGFKIENAKPSDPGVDQILMLFADAFRHQNPIQKSYWFDSRTKLLGLVSYTSPGGGVVHVLIDDYREIDGEKLPFRIECWEDARLMMRLALETAAFSAGAEDGIFGGN